MSDLPWDLPYGWRWVSFGDVASVASDLVDPAGYQDLPHVAPNHIESHTGRLFDVNTIKEDGVISPKHRFSQGQILYSKIRRRCHMMGASGGVGRIVAPFPSFDRSVSGARQGVDGG